MSFRRDGKDALQWKRWRDKHREALLRCGLPESVLGDRFSWNAFIELGGQTPLPDFDVSILRPDQAKALYEFIVAVEGENSWTFVCLRALQKIMQSK